MSRYLIVVHDDSATGSIDDWLRLRKSPASEQWSTRLNGTFSVRIVSPDVASAIRGRSFFTGVAMSEAASFVASGSAGWQRSDRARPRGGVTPSGSFVQASWTRHELRLGNDLFGTVPVLQAHGPGFVAFSDSLLVLTDLRDRFGLVNSPNAEALLARTGLSWRTAQNLSTETVVREITMVAPGRGVTVQCSRPLLVDTDETSLGTLLESSSAPVDAARRSAGFLASVLREVPGTLPTSVHLTPDGDAVLQGALDLAGTEGGVTLQADAGAVEQLRGRAGGRAIEAVPEISDAAALSGWAATGLGLYDVVAPSTQAAHEATTVTVDSAGNAIARRIWGAESAEGMRAESGLEGAAAEAYVAQVKKGLRSIGGDPTSPSSSQQHYVAFRAPRYVSAARSGRPAVHPLHTLSSAAVATTSAHFDGADGLDVLETVLRSRGAQTTDPAAAGRAALTLTELGGPLQDSEVPALSVLGSGVPATASTELSASIAAARGLGSSIENREVLVELMRDLVGVLPDELLPSYEPLLANARWHLVDRREPLAAAGPSVGRLLSLVLFAN